MERKKTSRKRHSVRFKLPLIDQALLLFGKPDMLYADIRAQRDGDVDDYFEIDLYYPSLKVKLKAGMLVPEETPRFVLRGTEGSYVKYGLDPQEAALSSGKQISDPDWGKEPEQKWGTLYKWDGRRIQSQKIETVPGSYVDFYRQLGDSITRGGEPPVRPDEAKDVIRLIELAQKSNDEGRVVPVSF